MISPKQEQVLDILATRDNMTAAEIAAELRSETKATSKHLRHLEDIGEIYVCEWRKGRFGVPTKAYKLGKGDSVVLVSKRKKSLKIKPDPEPLKYDTPRPDYAAAWLFHEPKVELLGAHYE
jgi:predicted ArsR family transcriptional regulator